MTRPISYAPAGQPAWRKGFRRALILVIFGVVAAFLVWRFGPRCWQPLRVAYLQRRALAYAAPRDFCVFRTDRDLTVAPSAVAHHVTGSSPDLWERYLVAARIPTGPVLFVGRRFSPAGHQRVALAHVAGSLQFYPVPARRLGENAHDFGILAAAVSPGTLTALPKVLVPSNQGVGGSVGADPVLRIYAGQADPVDRSHFTVVYQVGDERGTIDGWLHDDDTVKLQLRDGPAVPGTIRAD